MKLHYYLRILHLHKLQANLKLNLLNRVLLVFQHFLDYLLQLLQRHLHLNHLNLGLLLEHLLHYFLEKD